jgi:hypothetical protein
LLEVYKKYGVNWSMEQSGSLLSYLLRHNDKETIPLIEDRLAKWGEKSGSHIFYNLTRINFPEGLEKILRKRLESEEPEAVSTASYYLSKYPNAENRRLIEKRHEKWLKEWADRKAELDDPNADPKIRSQVMAQVELLNSLLRTESWKLSEAERSQLIKKCVTETCRRNFISRD